MDVEPRSPRVTVWPAYPVTSSDDPRDDPRIARMREDLGARLGRTCAHLSRDTFDELLRDICAMKLRWDPHVLERWRR